MTALRTSCAVLLLALACTKGEAPRPAPPDAVASRPRPVPAEAVPGVEPAAEETGDRHAVRTWKSACVATPAGPRVPHLDVCLQGRALANHPGVSAYLGIRYAKPPTGPLRFAPPEALQTYDYGTDMRFMGQACPQYMMNSQTDVFIDPDPLKAALALDREDCLTLNVWTPPLTAPAAPVLVFLHGGGFYMGGSRLQEITGPVLASLGIVVVTGNYRLGVLGGLAHPQLDSGNFALRDQEAILQWVQDHIAAFGGDPRQVTLAGESAGGMSVCYHLERVVRAGLPPDQRPFRRVILQSGPCLGQALDRDEAQLQGRRLAGKVCPDMPATAVPGCLRATNEDGTPVESVGTKALFKALDMKKGLFWGAGADFTPWRDGTYVPAEPSQGHPLAGLDLEGIDALVGSNGTEGSLITFLLKPEDVVMGSGNWAGKQQNFRNWVRDSFDRFGAPGNVQAVLDHHPAEPDGQATKDQWWKVAGRFTFTCPVRRDARAMAAAGANVWLYRFDHAPGFDAKYFGNVAYHTAELPFVFGVEPLKEDFTPDQRALADRMSAAWANFARTGNPNPEGAPAPWPRLEANLPPEHDPHRVFDLQDSEGTLYEEDCPWWDTLDAKP